MVTRDPATGAIIKSEPLTAPERAQWEKDTGRAQGVTGREEVAGHPGVYHVVSKDANGNTNDHYEDKSGATIPQPQDVKTQDVKTQVVDDGRGGKIAIVSKPDGTFTTQPVPGLQGATPTLTVQGTVYQLQPDGKTYAPAAGIENPNAPIPKGAPKFTPDSSDPSGDYGLSAYNEQLLQAQQAGLITKAQGADLLTQAGSSATVAKAHDDSVRSQASTTRGQDITQRGQDITEVASRRTAADTGFDNATTAYIGNAAHLGRGNGGLAADAMREALGLRQAYAAQAGGYADVPQTPLSPALQQARMTTVHPDGTVQVSHPVASAQGGQDAAAAQQAQIEANPAFRPQAPAVYPGASVSAAAVGPPPGAPAQSAAPAAPAFAPAPGLTPSVVNATTGTTGDLIHGLTSQPVDPSSPYYDPSVGTSPPVNMDPSQGPVGMTPSYLGRNAAPVWSPDPVVARLKAQGYPDDVIQQALAEHHAEYGSTA
jgi:hypothetical protein